MLFQWNVKTNFDNSVFCYFHELDSPLNRKSLLSVERNYKKRFRFNCWTAGETFHPNRESKCCWGKTQALNWLPLPKYWRPTVKVLRNSIDLRSPGNGKYMYYVFLLSFTFLISTFHSGEYSLQPRAVYNRIPIEGPKLLLNLLANTETPVSVTCKCMADSTSVVAKQYWPGLYYLIILLETWW